MQADWRTRTKERTAAFEEMKAKNQARLDLLDAHRKARAGLSPREAALFERFMRDEFDSARRRPAREQDNRRGRDRDRDDDRER